MITQSFVRCPRFARFLLGLCLAGTLIAAEPTRQKFDVPAGEASATLRQFASQSGQTVVYLVEIVRGVRTSPVQGDFTAREALNRMLVGTDLILVQDAKSGALTISRVSDPNVARAAQSDSDRPERKSEGEIVKLMTYEVFDSKLINADLPRTRDDIQPYVVFDRTQIDASMATNLDEFFRTRLPMNQAFTSGAQGGANNASSINLRGLGSGQTLVLLDGRRLPPLAGSIGATTQADLNGIPLGMIERIEVLPSTASGIYGGGATGGVINIITRKDYSGVEATVNYLNTFKSDAYKRRFELNGSFQLEGGRTMLTFNVSRVDGTSLLAQDSDLVQRGRALQLANNPSAFYGTSPPQGYTTNIRSQNGSNLVLKNGTALNSPFTSVPVGYAGPATDGGAALAANAGKYNLDLPDARTGRQSSYLATPDQKSYGLSLRRRFGDRVEIMVDASRLDNHGTHTSTVGTNGTFTLPVTAPNNPFTTPITVASTAPNQQIESTAFSRSDRLLAGLVVKLPHGWSTGLDYVWTRSRSLSITPQAVLGDPDGTGSGLSYSAAVTSGTLNVMRDLNAYPADYSPYRMANPNLVSDFTLNADEITLRGSGPVWQLPAGALVLSTSAQYREERIPGAVYVVPSTAAPAATYIWNPPVSSASRAYTAELRAPVFADTAPAGWKRGLELQLAVRRDESTATMPPNVTSITLTSPDGPFPSVSYVKPRFSATKATAGFKYSPIADVALRASWGTGFLAPAMSQLGMGTPLTLTSSLIDPKRGNQAAPVTYTLLSSGNLALRPEESESVSAGVVLTPRFLPRLRVSLDYTRIVKTNEIGNLSVDQLFAFEDHLPGAIVRAPLTPADQALGYTGGVVQQIDRRLQNIAGKRLAAYDLQADYTIKTTSWGDFQAGAAVTYQPDFSSKPFSDVGYTQLVGTVSQLKWRGNGGLTWTNGRLSIGWNLQYYDSYLIYARTSLPATIAAQVLNQGSSTIPSQVYHDFQLSYRWGAEPPGWQRLLAHTQLTLGVQNVLNTRPPALATTQTGANSGYSSFGDPRLARYTIAVRKRF